MITGTLLAIAILVVLGYILICTWALCDSRQVNITKTPTNTLLVRVWLLKLMHDLSDVLVAYVSSKQDDLTTALLLAILKAFQTAAELSVNAPLMRGIPTLSQPGHDALRQEEEQPEDGTPNGTNSSDEQ